jgi:hypothetical protein
MTPIGHAPLPVEAPAHVDRHPAGGVGRDFLVLEILPGNAAQILMGPTPRPKP